MKLFQRVFFPPAMFTRLRRFAATLVAGFAFALPASASTTFSADYTDLWFTAAESGWGVNIVQQNQVIFLSLFVYDGANLPRWYFASNMAPTSTTNFTGALYRSQGTSFASPWNPLTFSPTQVGTVTLNFTSPTAATLTYTVDGIQVVKSITRNSFAGDTFGGPYLGGLLANASSCNTSTNGYFIADRLVVDHSVATSPRFTVDLFINNVRATCTFTGTYAQQGRLGTIANGTWSCTGSANNAGTYTMTEIQATQNGLTAKFSGKDQYCQSITGFFGGLRDVQ